VSGLSRISNTVQDDLKNFGAFEPSLIHSILGQVIDAIECLHEHGTFHGNLSCGNMLWTPTKQILVTD
jgi:serine/threonine protein kinase